ncbi:MULTISPECIES: hypothetical protein [Colwellia]|uniref:Chromosome partition protein Smc n=1 Tax=Colwellia marinimaniae TaxID=1513592 RepID=A0ABQ0MWG4_9GAMM|nr:MULTISPECIES: hypothetical protein [Colwellia]GAW95966.1 chromosome partition protein Smc [Colwellia marinimaniae]
MFFVKFLESIFANSLKDKPGPSFAYAYLLSWIVVNYEYPLMLLSTKGELAVKITALKTIEAAPSYWIPIILALAVVIFKPLLNNIGLLSREGFDKLTQIILTKLNIKSYRTEEEFQAIVTAKEVIVTENSKLRGELSITTQAKEDLVKEVRYSKAEFDNLTSENSNTKTEFDLLAIKYKEIGAELAILKEEHNKVTEKFRSVTVHIAKITKQKEQLEIEIKEYSKKIIQLSGDLNDKEQQLDFLSEDVDKYTSLTNTTNKENSKLHSSLIDNRQRIASLKADLQRLNQEKAAFKISPKKTLSKANVVRIQQLLNANPRMEDIELIQLLNDETFALSA